MDIRHKRLYRDLPACMDVNYLERRIQIIINECFL